MCNVEKVSVIGVGTQGSMLTFRNAVEGKTVIGYARTEKTLKTCRAKIEKWMAYYIEKAKLTQTQATQAVSRIALTTSLEEALQHPDLVIENVPEDLSLKQKIFVQIDALVPAETLISTNTSSLLLSDIQRNIPEARKAKTFASNYDDPVRNSYVEVMWSSKTSERTKEIAMRYFASIGYQPIVTAKEIKGYSLNRTWRAVKRECLHLWAKGYITPSEFDRGWKMEWGTKFGPFQYMDLIGLDTVLHIEESYFASTKDERDRPPKALYDMVNSGKLGMKTGSGFYDDHDPEAGNLEVD